VSHILNKNIEIKKKPISQIYLSDQHPTKKIKKMPDEDPFLLLKELLKRDKTIKGITMDLESM